MKIFAVFLFALLIAGAGYFYFLLPGTTVEVVDGPRGRDANAAAKIHLDDYATNIDASISTLILGERSQSYESAWNFRGAIKSTTSTRTIFGSIQNVCSEFGNSDCWRISSLFIDGEPTPFGTGETKATDDSFTEITPTPEDESSPESSVEDTRATGEEQEPVSSLPEIWFTKTAKVNGRTGPGTDFSIAFKISVDVPLTFIKEQDNWGLFSYLAQGGGRGQIWISMNLVEQR